MADKATAVSFRYGTTGQHDTFVGVKGEITVDIETPTIWVHKGDGQHGTPLARQDLNNVSTVNITNKGIAKNDLTNINLAGADLSNVRSSLSSLGYAQRDLSDITSEGYDTLNTTYAQKTLSNVDKDAITTKLSTDTYVMTDLSNVTQTTLAGKGLAKTDLSNLASNALNNAGIANNTLENVTISDTTRDSSHLDLQKISNLVAITDPTASQAGTYPTAASVKTAIDNIPATIIDMLVNTDPSSSSAGQVTITASKTLISTPAIKQINGQALAGTWANTQNTNIWVFTPADSSIINLILYSNWIITIA